MTTSTTDPSTIEDIVKCISTKNRIADPMFSPNRFLFDDTASWADNTCNQTSTIVNEDGFLESLFNDFKF